MPSYFLKNRTDFQSAYDKSISKPEEFWADVAENFYWEQPWENVLKQSMIDAQFSWFAGGKTNITLNCLDRHLPSKGLKTAFVFEPNNPDEPSENITYNDLHERVCKLANVLRKKGIVKGDRVCIYLPMIPELVVSVLACARIGAIHSVVFAGFSSGALASRINDCSTKLVITSDGAYRGNKVIDLKTIVDEALISCPTVEKVLIVERTYQNIPLIENRDFLLKEELHSLKVEDFESNSAFAIPRLTYYLNKWIRHSGWYPNYQVRLFHKKKGNFAGILVHETVEIKGNSKKLKNPLFHYSYKSISDNLAFIDRYSTLFAIEKFKSGNKYSKK
jgi:acetyl-CoA synthetase